MWCCSALLCVSLISCTPPGTDLVVTATATWTGGSAQAEYHLVVENPLAARFPGGVYVSTRDAGPIGGFRRVIYMGGVKLTGWATRDGGVVVDGKRIELEGK